LEASNHQIPFGLKNGTMVGVSEVDSGLACDCVCPSCHRRLQAKKGQKVSHYFSHDPSEGTKACKAAFETSIHLMAKQIITEEGCALFPVLSIKVMQADISGNSHEEKGLVEEKSLKRFDRVIPEKGLDDIRPDIIAYQGTVPFLIEVAVTHFADSEKKKRIRAKSLHAIEIDLSKVNYTITKDELRQLIVEKDDNKKWLSNPAVIQIRQQLTAKLDESIRATNERIKENINRARQSTTTHYRTDGILSAKRIAPTKHRSRIKNTKQFDPRWFLCEACCHIFNLPRKDVPDTIDTIMCPECGHAVSTND
jgi:hypothetical protein